MESPGGPAAQDEVDEETTQIDSEIGANRQALKLIAAEEASFRAEMATMGPYAAGLAACRT